MKAQILRSSIYLFILFWSLSLSFAQESNQKPTLLLDRMGEYGTLEQILEISHFENKVVYIDLWYTSCGICLTEFSKISKLKEKYKGEAVEFLYVCVPTSLEWDFRDEIIWEKMVKNYKLQGINIKVDANFSANFWEENKGFYPEERIHGYPTYLLANKDGEIVDYDAPRPSTGEILYWRIEELLAE